MASETFPEDLRKEIRQLRQKVFQLEAQLHECKEQLKQEKQKNQSLEAQVKALSASDTKITPTVSSETIAVVEEVLLEQAHEVTGPFYEFGEGDSDDNIAYVEEEDDMFGVKGDIGTGTIKPLQRGIGSFISLPGFKTMRRHSLGPSSQNNSASTSPSTSRRGSMDMLPPPIAIAQLIEVKAMHGKEVKGNNLILTCKVIQKTATPAETESIKPHKTRIGKKNVGSDVVTWEDRMVLQVTDLISEALQFQICTGSRRSADQYITEVFNLPLSLFLETPTKDLWINFPGGGSAHVILTFTEVFKYRIKGGTLKHLIDKMTPVNKKDRDKDFIVDFLLSYQMFTTPAALFDHLHKRFIGPAAHMYSDVDMYQNTLKGIQNSVGFVIWKWAEHTKDFKQDMHLAEQVCQFLSKNSNVAFCEKALSVIQAQISKAVEENEDDMAKSTTSLLKTSVKINFDEVEPDHCADQMTLIEYDLMKNILNTEFINQAWNKAQKDTKAPHIIAYIAWFNRVSRWIGTEIIKRSTPEERSVIIAKFISVGMRFKVNNNFNGIMEVLSALHSSAISRLKQSWALLPSQIMDDFNSLNDLMSPNDNFKKYREANKTAKTPSIPNLALWLTDFTFIFDGNSDTLEPNLINFGKCRMVAHRIKDFFACVKLNYSFNAVQSFKHAILTAEAWDENDIYRFSKIREQKVDEMFKAPRYDSRQFARIAKSILAGKENVSTENLQLTSRDWQLLLATAQVKIFEKDDVIIYEGGTNSFLYRIKSGSLRVEKKMKTPESPKIPVNKLLAVLGPNTMFGEMSLVGIVTASVIADVRSEVYAMQVDLITSLFQSEAGLSMRFWCKVAQGLAAILVSLAPPPKKESVSTEEQPKVKVEEVASSLAEQDKANNTDAILVQKFGLEKGQVAIKQYQVSYKKKLSSFGTLYITKDYICFMSQTFGFSTTVKVAMPGISIIYISDEKILVIQQTNKIKVKFTFKVAQDCAECKEIVVQLWQFAKNQTTTTSPKKSPAPSPIPTLRKGPMTESTGTLPELESSQIFKSLPRSDWEQLLQGAKTITVPKDTVIITQGEEYQRIYQINRGLCRIEITKDGKSVRLGSMGQDETFGEISFLNGGKGASAHVIADVDDTSLTIIEGYYINALFNINPAFAGRFFKYLGTLLAHRIRERQRASS